MTRRLAYLFLCPLVAGCPSAPTEPATDAGRDAASAMIDAAHDDGGGAIDSGHDAASATDAGDDAARDDAAEIGSDAGRDAASSTDAALPMGDHLVFTEISVGPAAAELFEIRNPTAAAIALDDYYVSDNAVYHRIAAGAAWAPMETPGTDFLIRFPAGAMIAAGDEIVVALDPGFEAQFTRCPDFIASTAAFDCVDGRSAPAMRVPTNGALDVSHQGALLSDAREMLVLFHWDGAATTVDDVDYVTWGATFDVGATRVDKTGVAGYSADTAAASQHPASPPPVGQSIVRCGAEIGETQTGGNGITGHDETSEHLDTAFGIVTTPTPGVHGTCS